MPTYDNAYKHIFSHPTMVEDLLRGFVHEEWVQHLDFGTLEKASGSYVSDDLRDREDDIIWRVKRRDEWIYIYLLIEFQSSNEPWMALRAMVYVGLLYQDLIKRREVTLPGKLPPVFPIVIYNGEAPWSAHRDVADLIESVPGGLGAYRPSLRYHLLDEGRVTASYEDSTVRVTIEDSGRWAPFADRPGRGLGLRLMEALMTDVRVDSKDGGTRVTVEKRLDGAELTGPRRAR